MEPFTGMSVFVYHGEKDRNCPYQITVEQVDHLRAVGAEVEFVSDPALGHESPSADTYRKYQRWLTGILEGD